MCSTQVFSQIEANFNLIFLKFFSFFIRLKVKRGFGWGGVFCCWLGFFLVNKISLYFHVLSNHNHNPMLCCSSYSLAVNYAGINAFSMLKFTFLFQQLYIAISEAFVLWLLCSFTTEQELANFVMLLVVMYRLQVRSLLRLNSSFEYS